MTHIRKCGSLLLGAALTLSLLAGCSSNIPKGGAASRPGVSPSGAADGTLRTGLAVTTSISDSKDAGEKEGLAKTDATVVALTIDAEGRIAACIIDGVQTGISFSGEGKLTADLAAEPQSKRELGENYGLKKASGIGREWNEQAAAFAQYVQGKTLDEIKGIAVKEGVPTDADLAASVTIHVGDFVSMIEKAAANAQELGARAGDKLGLGIVTGIGGSADAGEKEGLAQSSSAYTAATFGADGKITSCLIDAAQANISFDQSGKISTDLTAAVPTKDEIGEGYGMRKASSIGKEWNEEAAAYAEYVTGKTIDEVKGIAVTEKGAPAEADLSASVTIGIGDFNAALEKAAATAE